MKVPDSPERPTPVRPPAAAPTVAAGGAMVLGGSVVGQVLMLLSSLYLARRLGPDRYGLYGLGITTLLVLLPVAGLGLPAALVRFVSLAVARGRRDEVWGALLSSGVLSLVSTGIAVGALALAAPWLSRAVFHEARMTAVLRWVALALPAVVVLDICAAAARSLGLMFHAAAAHVVRAAAFMGLLVIWGMGFGTLTVRDCIVCFAVAALISLVITSVNLLRSGADLLARPAVWQVTSLAQYTAPLLLFAALFAIARGSDRYIVAALFDSATTGRYLLVSTAALYLTFVHASLVTAFLPALADRYYAADVEGAGKLFQDVARLSAAATFPLVLVTVLLLRDALRLVGRGYEAATVPAVILVAAVYLSVCTGPTEGFLLVTDRQLLEVRNVAISLVAGLIAQLALGKAFGLSGVAGGVVVSVGVLNVLNVLQIKRWYGFEPLTASHLAFTAVTGLTLLGASLVGIHASAPARWLTLMGALAVYGATAGRSYVPRLARMLREARKR